MFKKLRESLVRCLRCGKLQETKKFPADSKIWAMYCSKCKKTKAGEIPNG